MLVTALGRAIRFPTTDVRVFKGREFDRRARHPAGRGRPGGVDVGHPPFRGRRPTSAPPTSRCAALMAGVTEDEAEADEDEDAVGRGPAFAGALCRDVGGRGSDPDHHRRRRRASSRPATTIRCAAAAARASRRWTRRCAAARWSPASRSSATTRSCSPPRPASRSAARSTGISFRSRSAGGVRVFDTGAGEEVVSVARIADQGDDDGEAEAADEG